MADEPAQSLAAAQAAGERRPEDGAQAIGAAPARVTAEATVGQRQPASGTVRQPAFDPHHPPARALVDDCVHCGFCLPTCPTYLLFGEEMDSPRGRIYLMREGLDGEPLTDTMTRHFDLCLGCLACVTACPSGVQYDRLIEATRQQVERRYPRPLSDRLFRAAIYRLFPYPRRLQRLHAPLALYQRSGLRRFARTAITPRLPARLRALDRLTPPVPRLTTPIPTWTPARGEERARVGLLLGCVQQAFFPGVNAATVRVLAADGCGVAALDSGCCGALSFHAGREEQGKGFARRTIDAFEQARVDYVVANVAGCGSAMKDYGELLADDPAYAARAQSFSARVRDATELLQELGPRAERRPLPLTAVYHDACHLAHGQGITRQPRECLRWIPDLEVREVPREREICCGSAGTYNLLEPDAAAALGRRKAEAVLAAGARVLVTANPGCHLQIQAALRDLGTDLPAVHLMEVLDASIRGANPAELLKT